MTQSRICNVAVLLFLYPVVIFADTANNQDQKQDCCGVKIFGYIDGSYNYLESSNRFISNVFDRYNDIEENGFSLQQFSLTGSYLPEQGFGGLVNVIYGRDALSISPFGYNPYIGHNEIGFTVYQLYTQYKYENLSILAGNFTSIAGYESVDLLNNKNFSRSFLNTFSQPNTVFGARAIYEACKNLKFTLGLNDGWDDIRDFSRGVTTELGMTYSPNVDLTISLAGYTGSERVFARTITDPIGTRNLLDVIITYQLTKKLAFAANYDYGKQNNVLYADGSSGTASWSGLAAYINYGFNEEYRASLRGEVFDDKNGYRTGVIQTLAELTLTLGYSPIKNLEFRAETRRDHSNQYSYQDKSSLAPRKFQQSYGLEAIYSFSNS